MTVETPEERRLRLAEEALVRARRRYFLEGRASIEEYGEALREETEARRVAGTRAASEGASREAAVS